MRIVSFVPAATAACCALGLRDSLVGVTHECGGVADLSGLDVRVITRSRVPSGATGTVIDGAVKTARANRNDLQVFDAQGLAELEPDVVIVPADAPEGRNPCTLSFFDIRKVTSVMDPAPRLLAYGPTNVIEILGSVRALGEALGLGADGARMAAALRARINGVRTRVSEARSKPRTALLSWIQPPIGGGGLLAQLVALAGGEPVAASMGVRARAWEWPELIRERPEVMVLAPCGFSLERARAETQLLRRVPGILDAPAARWGQVHLVDGQRWFSAAGIASVRALEILAALVHPELAWPDGHLEPMDARPVSLE